MSRVDNTLEVAHLGVDDARVGVAKAEQVIDVLDRALALSDRVLVDADRGIQAAEHAVDTGRRVAPRIAIAVGVGVAIVVAVVVIRKKMRSGTSADGADQWIDAATPAPPAGSGPAASDDVEDSVDPNGAS